MSNNQEQIYECVKVIALVVAITALIFGWLQIESWMSARGYFQDL
jgi:DNA-binding transcriptional regulator of glucitol operon